MSDIEIIKVYSAQVILGQLSVQTITEIARLCSSISSNLSFEDGEKHILCMLKLEDFGYGLRKLLKEANNAEVTLEEIPVYLSPMISLVVLHQYFESEEMSQSDKVIMSLLLKNAVTICVKTKTNLLLPDIINEMIDIHTTEEINCIENFLILEDDTKDAIADIVSYKQLSDLSNSGKVSMGQLHSIAKKVVKADYEKLTNDCLKIVNTNNQYSMMFNRAKVLHAGRQSIFPNSQLLTELMLDKSNDNRKILRTIRKEFAISQGRFRKTSLLLRYFSGDKECAIPDSIYLNGNEFLVMMYYQLLAESILRNG